MGVAHIRERLRDRGTEPLTVVWCFVVSVRRGLYLPMYIGIIRPRPAKLCFTVGYYVY